MMALWSRCEGGLVNLNNVGSLLIRKNPDDRGNEKFQVIALGGDLRIHVVIASFEDERGAIDFLSQFEDQMFGVITGHTLIKDIGE